MHGRIPRVRSGKLRQKAAVRVNAGRLPSQTIEEANMARKGGPALYELLSKSKGGPAPSGASPASRSFGSSGALDAGRASWIAWASVCLVAVVIAYLVGVSRGERLGREALRAERDEEMRLLDSARPAGARAATGPTGPAGTQQGAGLAPGPAGVPPEAAQASENRGGAERSPDGAESAGNPLPPLPVGVDPRQSGLSYFVIATVTEPSAIAMAQFCREKGLDAYVVPSNNGRFSEVIVLPGFPASERSGAAVKGLQERIRKVGVLYKNAGRNNPDFGDMYPRLHKP